MASIIDEPKCEQVIDMFPEPFVIIDRNYHIIAANKAYQNHYGIENNEVVGRCCHEVSHHSPVPCSRNGEHCPLEAVVATRGPAQVMHVHYDKQNKAEYVQLNAAPIMGEDGEVLYIGEYIHPLNKTDDEDTILVGRSRPLLRLASMLQRVAPTQTTVLLLGESGVGKERTAEYIHRYSERANGPFIVVDCGTLGETLIESELFGHEKGAFTGATNQKIGLFEAANGGTLFIDEICELPLALQTKLLRVLETGTIRRLGGTSYKKVDVRIIAATNRDIHTMVDQRQFRQDLYYRLSAFPMHVPSLRERKDDIAALAEFFLLQRPESDCHLPLSPEFIEALLGYDYPGNIRELRNIIERAAILAGDDVLQPHHLVFEGPRQIESEDIPEAEVEPVINNELVVRRGRLTKAIIMTALARCNGHRAQTASMLGVSERTLYRHIKRLRISIEQS